MAEPISEPGSETLLPTRQSLLSQLRDGQDQTGWREFFDAYWRLIYSVARSAGLADAEAKDVVQDTFVYLARRMPSFRYDRSRGSFKSWLRVVTRSRIHAFWRARKSNQRLIQEPLPSAESDDLEVVADPSTDALDAVWQREWEENLMTTALRRVRAKVSSRQLLVFRLSTTGDLPLPQVAKRLGLNLAQVYLARHRVGKLLKAEVQRLRLETE